MSTAVYSAMRPGELDVLRWEDLDFTPGAKTINVRRKWCPKTRRVNEPKNNSVGPVVMFAPLRDRLLAWKRVCPSSEWVFPTAANSWSRLGHFTPSTRSNHWKPLRIAAGLSQVRLYDCTRHYAGWYLTNVAELPPEVAATQFRHKDRGKTFRATYSHPDRARNLERIRAAVERIAPVVALPTTTQERGAA
jgi:integrase